MLLLGGFPVALNEDKENQWYGLINHSDMTDTDFALISRNKEELEKHWDDLIEITESQPEDKGSAEYYEEHILPIIDKLDELDVHYVDDEHWFATSTGNEFSKVNGKFFVDETPLIVLKQSHSRF